MLYLMLEILYYFGNELERDKKWIKPSQYLRKIITVFFSIVRLINETPACLCGHHLPCQFQGCGCHPHS